MGSDYRRTRHAAAYGDTAMSTTTEPQLLGALDQFTNALHWYHDRQPLDPAEALTEALDTWIGEHAAEHHHSEPFAAPATAPPDRLAAVLTQLVAAVEHLATGPRPDLITAVAIAEALDAWAAEQAAEHHHSLPFQRPAR